MRGSDFIFELVQLLYYKCHKINFKRRGITNWFSRLDKREKSNNKSEKYGLWMFSLCGNCCIKLWRN